ncbi:MAG TPA: alpha/beta fold hydrolase [Acidimicrobiales bacterium]|nr:alpha/beta fold hydrolase [Acidimicrobiales bacterium]
MIWRFGDHEVDTGAYELRRAGVAVPLEPQVFGVLAHLIAHRDRVVAKEELLDAVWGDRFVSESALTSRIKAARRAVGDDGRRQAVIRTAHGRGYRFVADASEVDPVGVAGRRANGADPAAGDATRTGPGAPAPAPPPPAAAGATGAPAAPPVRTRYTRDSGHEIAFQVVGEGPDVVFVPGFVSNLDLHWEHPGIAGFLRRLASFCRLTTFDKRGTGVSERVPVDRLPTLEERMDDLRAVLDAAGVGRATIFGISEGGPMALLFAATYPERVERLVLYGTFASDPFDDPARNVDNTRRSWGRGSVFGSLAPSWSTAADRSFFARFERQSATPEGAAALVRLTSETDARATLSSISAPTLVIHRRGDRIVPFDRAEALAAGIEGAELVALPGADHFVGVDPDPILDPIQRFVTGVPARRPGERVLTTMLLVEVVGASDGAVEAYDRADRVIAHSGGVRVDAPASGVLATFDGPARAVRCGLSLAAAVAQAGVPLRCGVHTSEVERLGRAITGIGVQVAAGVAALAVPGEVLVTRTVRDLVAGSGLCFAPRGGHTLRGLPETWELFAATG